MQHFIFVKILQISTLLSKIPILICRYYCVKRIPKIYRRCKNKSLKAIFLVVYTFHLSQRFQIDGQFIKYFNTHIVTISLILCSPRAIVHQVVRTSWILYHYFLNGSGLSFTNLLNSKMTLVTINIPSLGKRILKRNKGLPQLARILLYSSELLQTRNP